MEHPEYLFAAALALVPLLVYGVPHLRVQERNFPALHFLLRRYPTRFQRFRSLNRVLIAVRTVLVLMVVALFIGPSTPVATSVPAGFEESVGLVLVVSNSLEMSRSTPEGTYLDLARRKAATWLEQSDRDRFLVIGTCEGVPESAAWGDRYTALAAVRDLPQSFAWCPAGPAVAAARRRWAGDAVEVVVVYHPGDAEPLQEALADPTVTRLPVLPGATGGSDGATLLDATLWEGRIQVVASLRCANTELSVRCRGTGEAAAVIQIAGPGVRSVEVVPDGACAGGWWEVSLGPDGLDADDHLWIPTPVRSVMNVLLVDGGFGGRLEDRRTRFLEPALRALDGDGLPLRLQVITQEELTAGRISAADLVILGDPHPLRAHLRRALAAHMERGGGLITTAGPRLARWEEGLGLLPGAWRVADLSLDPGPALEVPSGVGFQAADMVRATQTQGHPVVIRRRLVLSGIGGLEADTVVRFDDGVPAVVRWRRGGGLGFLWAVSADLSFGALPLHAAFPLILGSQVREVAAGLRTHTEALRCEVGVPCPVTPLLSPGWDLTDGRGQTSPDLQDRLVQGLSLEPGPYVLRRGDERRLLAVLDLPRDARRALAAEGGPQDAETHARRLPPPLPTGPLHHRAPVRFWVAFLAMILLMVEGWVALRQ
ncbi:MAG: hypothetical protein ABIK09_17285 [Pseudomonadota bacterium]